MGALPRERKPYQQLAYPKYNQTKKKLPEILRKELNLQENLIAQNPLLGMPKKGELRGIYVHKFNLLGQEYLLAYRPDHKAKAIIFLAIGGHENFYRDLAHYLKKQEN
ncbi:type II toxin-antitoxin system RelE/ParE family toxin [Candidatus Acetothermia bacterium]|nr:type II toxin-antitoxin system RelE/ParE family toxin [Candidatus Acetothermia bacterium]MBI3459626.1 type II toxin-antitoxin system RelE/ParE family toxin [Candidatus Acetothermia bacterium]MBI3659592.1 type II toxin-antitoxin system RelE/ParE family toxin [Candidatus Acetothermia bacterium]